MPALAPPTITAPAVPGLCTSLTATLPPAFKAPPELGSAQEPLLLRPMPLIALLLRLPLCPVPLRALTAALSG